jgi:hypothetical protein
MRQKMDKEKNEEQEFLRNIDRFLNGEEITFDEDASEDARLTMEFAQKLTELRDDPSPEFQERLKLRLLRKLTEQETAARERAKSGWLSGFLERLIPQSPVWRTAVVTVAIVVVAAGVMWRTGIFSMTSAPEGDVETAGENGRGLEEMASEDEQKVWSQNGIVVTEEEEEEETLVTMPPLGIEDGENFFSDELEMEVEISSSDIIATLIGTQLGAQYGSEITWTLTVKNTSTEHVAVGPFPPEIAIVESTGLSPVRTLPAVDISYELAPSETLICVVSWDQLDNDGAQVPAGTYQFNIESIVVTRRLDSFAHVISLPFVEVVILEPRQ